MDIDPDPDSDFDPEEKNPNKRMHWTLILLIVPTLRVGTSSGRSGVQARDRRAVKTGSHAERGSNKRGRMIIRPYPHSPDSCWI
jgi:hypothetical protein